MTRPVAALVGTVLILAAPAVAHADKLVIFHNGRTLRVQEIRQDGDWSYLSLGKRSEIGVLNRLIASVEEVEGATSPALPNVQAAAASGGAGSVGVTGGRPAPTRIVGGQDQPIPMTLEGQGQADPEAPAAAARARSDALARAVARSGRNRDGEAAGEGEAEGPPGIELGAGATPGRWPSLLDRTRPRGRDAGSEAGGEPPEDDADPQK